MNERNPHLVDLLQVILALSIARFDFESLSNTTELKWHALSRFD